MCEADEITPPPDEITRYDGIVMHLVQIPAHYYRTKPKSFGPSYQFGTYFTEQSHLQNKFTQHEGLKATTSKL
jgi:hypothetical protein